MASSNEKPEVKYKMASTNEKIEIKIEKMCRTCLSKERELNSLFDVFVGEETLDYLVTAITGLKIRKGDGLPATICCICRDKAEKAFEFKKKSQEAYNFLKGFIKDEKSLLLLYDDNTQKSIEFKIEDSQCSDRDGFSDADYSLPIKNGPLDMENMEVKVKVKHESSNREYLECKKCCIIFQTRAKYQEHKKRKCVKVEFEDQSGTHCPICGTNYDGASSLSNHMWQFHADVMGPKKRGRPKKPMTSTILSKLTENGFFIKTLHGKKTKCGFCKQQVGTKEDLKSHMFQHSDVKVLCCSQCKKMFLKKKKFDAHQCVVDATKTTPSNAEEVQDNTIYRPVKNAPISTEMYLQELLDPDWETNAGYIQVCSSCSSVFLTDEDLQRHYDEDHPELSLRCNHCSKVFASVKTASRHRALCKDIDRTHRCSICGLKFAYEISLNKHVLRYHQGERVFIAHHGKESKIAESVQYQCDTCNKKFQRKEALAKHAKLHMPNQKLFECEICQRKFNRSDNLRTHKRIHDVDRPKPPTNNHLCLYCGRGFTNSSNLIVHMRRHTGEKPYKCDFCEKGFPRSSDLMVHRRSHTGEKPCVCRLCGKAFSRSNKLSRHMRVHTGQRPYKCTYCEKAFSQSNDLTLHVRRHTGDRPYICNVCGDRFIQGTALQNHRRAHGHFSEPVPPLTNPVQTITYAVTSVTHPEDSHLSNTIGSI